MKASSAHTPKDRRGFTLVELIIAIAILMILACAAIPLIGVDMKRQKERELRRDLWAMRDAIDRYQEVANRGQLQVKVGSDGYPPDLETLVKGADVSGKKIRFLRRIPVDPMTGKADWGMSRTTLNRNPTADRPSLMCTASPRERGWMGRNTRLGE
jgi:general secretion pathway protein G